MFCFWYLVVHKDGTLLLCYLNYVGYTIVTLGGTPLFLHNRHLILLMNIHWMPIRSWGLMR